MAHYANGTIDIEYKYPFGWGELWGIANRGDYDLRRHMKNSRSEFATQVDPMTNESFVPHVIEPALGMGRVMFALLLDGYTSEMVNGRERVVLKFHRDIAPYQMAILPLSRKPELSSIAEGVFNSLSSKYRLDFDVTGSIGKRYRRQDEIGTPLCITVDFDTVNDNCVTVRDRDTMQQVRVPISDLEFDDALNRFG